MRILILMAGEDKYVAEHGKDYPKYLLEMGEKTLIQHVLESLSPLNGDITFIVRKEDNEKFFLGNTLRILSPESNVISVSGETKGAVCTALFAIDDINNENELLVLNGIQLINYDLHEIIQNFRDRKLDGGILTFNSVHPKWSYVRLNEEQFVVQTSEKRPISNMATAGCYYYKSGVEFIDACFSVIRKDTNHNGSYYISSTYNEMILKQKKIGVFQIPRKKYLSFADVRVNEININHKNNSYD